MKFFIDGFTLIISINGSMRLFPNTHAGYRAMASAWLQAREGKCQ